MKYFDVSGYGFTLRVFYEEKLGKVTITDIHLRSRIYGGKFYPGGEISVNGVPVLSMSYYSPATHCFPINFVGETFFPIEVQSGVRLPVSSERLYGKATISVDVMLWRDSNTNIPIKGSMTFDLTDGVVYIDGEVYMPYIHESGIWDAYGAYKGNGASFDMFSA